VSKAIGVPLAKLAAKVMTGMTLRELGFTSEIVPTHYSVKEAVFPFLRFEGANISLGPEMKSTGEVMGIDPDLGLAFAKSQLASQWPLPTAGNVFISVKDIDKPNVTAIAREYAQLGFGIIATSGTAGHLAAADVEKALGQALGELDDEDRLLMKLYYFEGLRLREAGAVLGVHEATASRRLTRIHGEIRQRVEAVLMKEHGWTKSEASRSLSEVAEHLQTEVEPMLTGKADSTLQSSPASG
jgi:hypothetical protein